MSASERLTRILAKLETLATDPNDPSRTERVLRARAVAAAKVRDEFREPLERLLAFRAAGKLYGVPLESVSAITLIRSMTLLPGVPAAFAGLLNVRGRHVTAIDLGAFLEGARIGDASKAITVVQKDRELALIAEELVGVRDIFENDVQEVVGLKAGSVVTRLGPDGMQVIDPEALFADTRLGSSRRR